MFRHKWGHNDKSITHIQNLLSYNKLNYNDYIIIVQGINSKMLFNLCIHEDTLFFEIFHIRVPRM